MKIVYKPLIGLLLGCCMFTPVSAERIKDMASIAGVRSNQLIGYGLVVGLDKSGDKTRFTGQSMLNMLSQLGIVLPSGIDPKSKNIAAVALSADLPAFAKPGQKIDLTVSSIGDAKSLRGGTLLMSSLKGADGNVYAIAQGNLVVDGISVGGQDGSKVTVNNPSVGRIPGGASVERSVPSPFDQGDAVVFNLNEADFTTANRMAEAINKQFGANTAKPIDATSVRVYAPADASQRVSFAAMLENVQVTADDAPAKIIVNSRSGTVVINGKVTVRPAAVSHGSLTVTVNEDIQVSQPEAFSGPGAQTAITPSSGIKVAEGKSHMMVFNPGVSLNEIVNAVNAVGAGPIDLIAILEALKVAGAIRAELIII